MSLTKVTYSMIQGAVYNVLDYGITTAAADNSTAIAALLVTVSAAGGGTVYFPTGTYKVKAQVLMRSNVRIVGDGSTSVIKIDDASAFTIFYQGAGTLTNIAFENIGFDGSLNYPAGWTTNGATYTLRNFAIRTSGCTVTNFLINNCVFNGFSVGSIDLSGDSSRNIAITNNTFRNGAYSFHVIDIRSATLSPLTTAIRPKQILIDGNTIDTCGPQYWYDPSVESWCAACGIVLDRCMNSAVSNNRINNTASIGIRVEESLYMTIEGNSTFDTGQSGIVAYKQSYYTTIVGNTIVGWGKIPESFAIQNYTGTYVYAKEFPSATYAPLPANPLVSPWWALWDYDLTNVDTTKIAVYSPTNYYTTGPTGILPFRGNAAIAVEFESAFGTVSGNTCVGNLTKNGAAYYYASNFGYTMVHPVNSSTIASSGDLVSVTGNHFKNFRDFGIYAPIYQDPINAQSFMGVGEYLNNYSAADSIAIFQGVGRMGSLYLTPTVSMTTGTGSPEAVVTASLGSSYYNLSGGANTTLYVKESGAGNTGWVAK